MNNSTNSQQAHINADGDGPSLLRMVNEIEELHPISAACARVLEVAGDRRSSADDLAAVIDPAMTARLLRLANSAHYGQTKRIATLHDAVLLLGFGTVRGVAMSGCVVNGLGEANPQFDAQRFWFFAVTVAQLTQLIASAYRRHRDEAFTAGVLHGMGRLALAQFRPDQLDGARRLAGEEHISLADAQLRLLGFTEQQLGGALATRWNFPESLVEAIERHQLDPLAHRRVGDLAADVGRAHRYARAYGLTDGIEKRQRREPDAEWFVAPLSITLTKAGGMPGLRDGAQTFVERALGLDARRRAA